MDQPLFDLPDARCKHPAQYTEVFLTHFARMAEGCKRILDPFAGTGGIFALRHWLPDVEIRGLEIEPEWAYQHPMTTVGSALQIPWDDGYFDCIITSPTYGNRMADGLTPEDSSYTRISYADSIGRQLHEDNSGSLQWGENYRRFHKRAWAEVSRVLCDGGFFILNIKNHIRGGEEQYVSEWHVDALEQLGYEVREWVEIITPGMRFGQNHDARVRYENVIKLVKR